MDLLQLIKEVLDFNGFVIEYDGVPLMANKGGDKYTIVVIRDAREREFVEHMETERKLFVISLDDSVRDIGDIFWDRKMLETMIGRALLSRAVNGEKPGGTIIDSFESAFIEYKEPVASVRIESHEEDIEDAFSSSQELHPFYTYYFDVKDSNYPDSGILLVSALDKKAFRAVDRLRCDASALSSVPRIEPKISESDARNAATDFLVGEHTKEEDVVKEEGTVTVMEKRVTSIDPNKIDVKLLGMLYVPFLNIENPEGTRIKDISGITRQKNY